MLICSIKGCNEKHKAKGFCRKHYLRFKKYGDPMFITPGYVSHINIKRDPFCIVDGCTLKHYALGYCERHHDKYKKYGDPLVEKNIKHGLSRTPEYKVWIDMKSRCLNANHKAYKYYGGRGIVICDRWLDFRNFYKDMGVKNGMELDRINSDGNYEPGNCRWINHTENMRNRRVCKMDMKKAREIRQLYKNKTYPQNVIAKMYGVSRSTIYFITDNRTWKEE